LYMLPVLIAMRVTPPGQFSIGPILWQEILKSRDWIPHTGENPVLPCPKKEVFFSTLANSISLVLTNSIFDFSTFSAKAKGIS
jgi:hypothetical protein